MSQKQLMSRGEKYFKLNYGLAKIAHLKCCPCIIEMAFKKRVSKDPSRPVLVLMKSWRVAINFRNSSVARLPSLFCRKMSLSRRYGNVVPRRYKTRH